MKTTIILATRHADGTTTRHPQAGELFDKYMLPDFIARLSARLANKTEPPMNPHAHCLRCQGENPSDLPICGACMEAGATPSYRFGTCLICDARLRVKWEEELPSTCGESVCVTRFAQIARALAGRQ
jgi:hypothetical protein